MKIIFKKAYSYLLIQDEENWYLTFFTGGPVEIDICVKLTENEINQVSSSQTETESLVDQFKNDRSLFEGRRVTPSVVPGRPGST